MEISQEEIARKLEMALNGKHEGHHCPSCDTEDCPRCTALHELQDNATEIISLLLTEMSQTHMAGYQDGWRARHQFGLDTDD